MSKKSVYDIITEQVLEHLENGDVPWHKPWAGGGAAKNMISGQDYRGMNVFMLALSAWAGGYSSPYWLTFKQAKQLGGHVRKGETGTTVIFWKVIEQSPSLELNESEEDQDDRRPRFVLRYYNVFNLEQCDGIENPDVLEGREFNPIEECDRVVAAMPNAPEILHEGASACYIPSQDKVKMPPQNAFVGDEEYYSTLFHELGHSTGHDSRLGRHTKEKCSHMFGSKDYSKEELVAEMTAAFLCGHTNIENKTIDNSIAYIQSWAKAFKNKPKMVVCAAAAAQKAADYILNK